MTGGYLLDKYNCRLYLALVLLCFGILTALIPVGRNFVELIVISFILGIFGGALDCGELSNTTEDDVFVVRSYKIRQLRRGQINFPIFLHLGQNVTALLIWGWDGAILMQSFHCVFALGTFVAPWLAAPFISSDAYTIDNETTTISSVSFQTDDNTMSVRNIENYETITDTTNIKTLGIGEELHESNVHFTFLIIAAYEILSSGLFVVSYIFQRKYSKVNEVNQENGKNKNEGVTSEKRSSFKRKEPKWFLFPMLGLMFLRFAFYVGLDVMSASFLMTFAVKGLGWTKSQGIAVISCFRGVYSLGRVSSVLLALIISPTKMIMLDIFLILTGLFVLTIFINFHDLILWIFISLAGFGMGSFYGASMSWADKYMNVTGKTGSVFITGSWFGLLSLPALTGYLFDNVSPYCYIYACFGSAIAVAVVTFLAMGLVFFYNRRHVDQNSFFPPQENVNVSVKSFQIMS